MFKNRILAAGCIIVFSLVMFTGCVPKKEKEKNKTISEQSSQVMDILKIKIKDGTIKDVFPPQVEDALAERIRTGKIEDFMPPTAIILGGLMVPTVTILAFIAFLIILVRLYHIRVMARIEKGVISPGRSFNIKWEFVTLFLGIVLSFLGPAISILTVSLYGLASWSITSGIIPLFIGLSFLVFYKIYLKINNQ